MKKKKKKIEYTQKKTENYSFLNQDLETWRKEETE